MGAQIALHCANAGIPVAAARPHRRCRAAGPREGAQAEARSAVHARRLHARHDRRLRHASRSRSPTTDWIMEAVVERLDIKQQLLARVDEKRRPGIDRQLEHVGHSDRARSPKAARTTSARTGSARTSSTRRATCACSRSSRPPKPIRRWSPPMAQFGDHVLGKGVVVAKDTPNFIGNHIALYGVARTLEALASGSTPSKRSTRSPVRRSAGPAARRSGRWTSPASTCSRT